MRRLLLVALTLAGCAKVTYVNPAIPANGQVHATTGHFFLFGLAGTADIPAGQMCPGGVSRVQSKESVGDVLLGVFTLGLYTPRSYEIDCGGAR